MGTHLLLRPKYGNVIIHYVNHHGETLNQTYTNKTSICFVSDTRFIWYKASLWNQDSFLYKSKAHHRSGHPKFSI